MNFIPNENENRFVEQALEGSIGLVNLIFHKLPLEARQQLNLLVFGGAEVMVQVVMSPNPSIAATISANDHSLELFRIEAGLETCSETTH